MNNLFSIRLKEYRKSHGLSQDALAKILGTSKQVISHYETGQRIPKISVVQAYAKTLNIDSSYFLEGSSPTFSPATTEDKELTEYLEILKTRPECRMLFKLTKDASKADVEKAVAIVEALRRTEEQ